jgi:hypothetical protein
MWFGQKRRWQNNLLVGDASTCLCGIDSGEGLGTKHETGNGEEVDLHFIILVNGR